MRRLVVFLALLLTLSLAPAARADFLGDINVMRSSVGLPALTPMSDPLVGSHLSLAHMADSNGPDALSQVSGAGCGCWLYGKSILQRYREAGGKEDVIFWGISRPLEKTPALWQVVLDPRAVGIRVSLRDNGYGAIAVWFDRTRSWTRPLAVHPDVDLTSTRPPAILLPPAADGKFTLEERVGGQWKQVPSELSFRDGLDGAGLVLPWKYNYTDLAAGRRYRLLAAGGTAEFRTRPVADPPGSWKFDVSVPPLVRRRFLRAIADARPAARRLLRRVAGEVLVRANNKAETSFAGTLSAAEQQATGRHYYIDLLLNQMTERRDNEMWRAVALHEAGHTLDFAGISDQAMQRFRRSFSRARGWREVYAEQWLPEIFAEQFLQYAVNRRFYEVGHLYPVLISDRAFGRQLHREWARAPTPGWFNFLQE